MFIPLLYQSFIVGYSEKSLASYPGRAYTEKPSSYQVEASITQKRLSWSIIIIRIAGLQIASIQLIEWLTGKLWQKHNEEIVKFISGLQGGIPPL